MDTYTTHRLGIAAFERRDYAAALRHFTEVLQQAPEHLDSREYLARTHYHRAGLSLAEAECRRILETDPTNEYVLLLLARTLERQSRTEEAVAVRRRLAAVSGDDAHLANHTLI